MNHDVKEKLINFREDLITINKDIKAVLEKDKNPIVVIQTNNVSIEDIKRNERIIQVIEEQLKKEFGYDVLNEQ